MKLKALVPNIGDDEVKWLEIESDENDTKGYFLYYFISEHFAYDSWFQSLEEAFSAASGQYSILPERWEKIED